MASNVEIPIWIDKSLADQPTLTTSSSTGQTKQIMMNEEAQIESIDGRRKRSAQPRRDYHGDADTARKWQFVTDGQANAEEAGVGLRSFFRHFEDMDALLEAVDQQAANITNICFFAQTRW